MKKAITVLGLIILILVFSIFYRHTIQSRNSDIMSNKNIASSINSSNTMPVSEPNEYKTPYQWKLEGYTQRHGLIRTANTVWSIKGILEPNQEVWDELVAWSGSNENGKQVIGIFVDNGQVFDGKYDAICLSPNQNIGKIYITNVNGDVLYLKSENGTSGTFNIDTKTWTFNK
ncbi:MAG: hypothetical protein Q8920_01310 [Bacillota bacterium]|nr:hypothetical protein [Bacillota bacterium]